MRNAQASRKNVIAFPRDLDYFRFEIIAMRPGRTSVMTSGRLRPSRDGRCFYIQSEEQDQ
jgi:hypothetical protein